MHRHAAQLAVLHLDQHPALAHVRVPLEPRGIVHGSDSRRGFREELQVLAQRALSDELLDDGVKRRHVGQSMGISPEARIPDQLRSPDRA
jgi:hypothetical protein